MRLKILFFIVLILIALLLIALKRVQTFEGPHGGRIEQAGNYYIELKPLESGVYAYLNDGHLKPVSNRGISCELKVFFPDNTELKVFMKATGEEGFYTDLSTNEFLEYEISFYVRGKIVRAHFKNEKLIVRKKSDKNETEY